MFVNQQVSQPQKAIEKIIDFTWDYYIANPLVLKMCIEKIKSKGVHYAKSQRLLEITHALAVNGILIG